MGLGMFGASLAQSVFDAERKKYPQSVPTPEPKPERINREERDMPFPQRSSKGASVKPEKAKQILKDKEVRGKPLTDKQEGFFGARAGGAPMAPRNPPGRKRR